MIQPVILCGGSGTRLWPLSRKALPKQFVPLIQGKSLLALTLERVAPLTDRASGVMCVGSEDHRFLVREAIGDAGLVGSVILEPFARNTAAAMAMAALKAPCVDQLLLFCPSDHHIPDVAAFAAMVRGAMPCARQGRIVTFGVMPTFPSTGYGYIDKGQARDDGGHAVGRFIEKPASEKAQQLLLTGNVLWNAGIFLCRADNLLAALAQHAPDILASCREAMMGAAIDCEFVRPAADPLETCRSESIDYAVMERHGDVAVFPFAGAWSDVGSWNAVAEMCPPDEQGNRIEGQGVAINANNNFVHAPNRCVVALGVDDLVIVDTPDAVLVARREGAEQVQLVVPELEKRGTRQAVQHRLVLRPWGSYDSIENGSRFQVKRIVVKPNASLSLQKHYHRAEHWIVVKGTAEVTRGKETFLLSENQSTYIPLGEVHRLHNPGKTALEMIEVQSGAYLEEDDIVRLDDQYGRIISIAIATKQA
ncbi:MULTISPECIES: mannose-1-phosphate guanylyltransferase/mannose-6-phosphate isomerase [Ramlibacter]|uniref:mannose-1-phosphate guanylyltransferase n=1 Tax=Ramlibacter pinisoli TaxID=2682844 RepID=A0A6N8IV15_9BURK|nr:MULTISPECIES: mannose-1-phosphate guanylyltransferase/mannose-6-phosphate isomerase [Ramlibacter]MBA2964818.1 mannose-1-phosphate guanylyltransferase/mannose-6-phosphate isomerase [Ramlibacter sp. CGMCC 1.13660]MVQ29783.1 mannose-1-phosphate guanylyltransferase/mannose-6-phosphate isomerase [Ramlibacter pinisoli]